MNSKRRAAGAGRWAMIAAALVGLAGLAGGCSSGAVRKVDQNDWIRELNRSALNSELPSRHTLRESIARFSRESVSQIGRPRTS